MNLKSNKLETTQGKKHARRLIEFNRTKGFEPTSGAFVC